MSLIIFLDIPSVTSPNRKENKGPLCFNPILAEKGILARLPNDYN